MPSTTTAPDTSPCVSRVVDLIAIVRRWKAASVLPRSAAFLRRGSRSQVLTRRASSHRLRIAPCRCGPAAKDCSYRKARRAFSEQTIPTGGRPCLQVASFGLETRTQHRHRPIVRIYSQGHGTGTGDHDFAKSEAGTNSALFARNERGLCFAEGIRSRAIAGAFAVSAIHRSACSRSRIVRWHVDGEHRHHQGCVRRRYGAADPDQRRPRRIRTFRGRRQRPCRPERRHHRRCDSGHQARLRFGQACRDIRLRHMARRPCSGTWTAQRI